MQDNQPYIIGQQPRKIRHVRWVRIVVALTMVCVAVMITIIAVSTGKKHIRVAVQNYYYVQMGEYYTLSDCDSKVLSLQKTGGGGYVINDGKFRVMAFVYLSKDDAQQVVSRLNDEGQNATIYTMQSPQIKLEIVKDNVQNSAINRAITSSIGVFSKVYDITISLDKAEISESLALLQLENLKKELAEQVPSISVYNTEYSSKCVKLISGISAALNSNTTQSKPTINLKYILCSVANAISQGLGNF